MDYFHLQNTFGSSNYTTCYSIWKTHRCWKYYFFHWIFPCTISDSMLNALSLFLLDSHGTAKLVIGISPNIASANFWHSHKFPVDLKLC